MRHVKMLEAHEGCKFGDVVAFENIDESRALVAAGKAVEVRRHPDHGEWVVVNRQEAVVEDQVGLSGP